MTDTGRIRLIGREENGKTYTSNWVWALLFGVDIAEVDRHLEGIQLESAGFEHMPVEWRQAGMRRAGEAQAHTDSDAIAATLRYWAEREHGRSVVFESDTEIWLV